MATWIEIGLLALVGLLLALLGNRTTRRFPFPAHDPNTIGAAVLVSAIVLLHLLRCVVFPFAQWNMYVGPGHGTKVHTVVVTADDGPTAVALDELYPSLDHSRAHAVLRKLLARSPDGRGPVVEWLRALATRWQESTGRPARRVAVWASDATTHGIASAVPPPGHRILWVNIR